MIKGSNLSRSPLEKSTTYVRQLLRRATSEAYKKIRARMAREATVGINKRNSTRTKALLAKRKQSNANVRYRAGDGPAPNQPDTVKEA